MAFRDRIEAILQAKDVQRFKAGMKQAARAVKDLGHEGEKTSAELEVLEAIEKKLEHQTEELAAAIHVLASAVDEMGDEMLQTAAKSAVMNTAMKRSNKNALLLGKSWAFWKDRLSLTRSEILTTSLTIGSYLSPALVALGSNFAHAAIGGGAVAGAGLATFAFGLGSLGIIAGKAKQDLDKIGTAQQQLLLTQEQYGKSSIQASRANARLYATIQQRGGSQAAGLLMAGQNLRDRFYRKTAPARRSVYGIAGAAVGAGQRLLPQYGRSVNQMAGATAQAAGPLLKVMSGQQGIRFMKVLGDTFSKSIGPVAKIAGNMFQIIGRIIEVSAPYVVQWAESWERTTAAWEKGTRSRSALERFIGRGVSDLKQWWRLGKEIGRTFGILFGATRDRGSEMLTWLTKVVGRFNDWLQLQSDTGKIDAFYSKWLGTLQDIHNAILDPGNALDDYVLPLVEQILAGLAMHSGEITTAVINAWFDAGTWTKIVTGAFLIKRMGPGILKLATWTAGVFAGKGIIGGLVGTLATKGKGKGKGGVLAGILGGQGSSPLNPLYVVVVAGGGGPGDILGGKGKLGKILEKIKGPGGIAAGRATLIGMGFSAAAASGFIAYMALTHNLDLPTKGKGASSPSNPAGHVKFDQGAPMRRMGTEANADIYKGWGGDPKPLRNILPPVHVTVKMNDREVAKAVAHFNNGEAARAGGFRHQRTINEY